MQLLGWAWIAAIAVCAALFSASVMRGNRRATRALIARFGTAPNSDLPACDAEDAAEQFRLLPEEPGALDDVTWNDLDMDRVFVRVNACITSVGDESLYACLRRPSTDTEELARRERRYQWFLEHPEARERCMCILSRLGREPSNGLSRLAAGKGAKPLPHAALYRVLSVLPVAFLLLLPVSVPAGAGLALAAALGNCLLYARLKYHLDADFLTLRYFSGVLDTVKTLLRMRAPGWAEESESLREAYAPFARLTDPMAASYRSAKAAAELQALADTVKMAFLWDVVRYNRCLRAAGQNRAQLSALLTALGEIDAAIAVLSFRKSLPGYCIPTFLSESCATFAGLVHPLLKAAVPNDGALTGTSLVTGSNASGKSTFLKAVAVNAILAETIHTCCAARFSMRPAPVLTAMAVRDDLLTGESYFVREIRALKRLLDAAGRGFCLLIVDEILRGTNTRERIAAASAVLRYLAARDAVCLAATHDLELTTLLRDVSKNYHFTETVDAEGITFDYRLRSGAADTRNAILLLERMGFPPEIVSDAHRGADTSAAY